MVARAYESGLTVKVGAFFQSLVMHLFGGTSSTICDFEHEATNTGVEVKSSDNNHPFRIALPQLLTHLKSLDFPFDNFVYVLIGYTNGKAYSGEGRLTTQLSEHNQGHLLKPFLSSQAKRMFILDARVVSMLDGIHGPMTGSIPCHPNIKTIDLNRADLRRIIAGETVQPELEHGGTWSYLHGNLRLRTTVAPGLRKQLSLEVYSVLPKKLEKGFLAPLVAKGLSVR